MEQFQVIANKTFQGIFERDCPYSLDELKKIFAFDIKLPTEVEDSTTGEKTYTAMPNAKKYITNANQWKHGDWIRPKTKVSSLKDLLKIWEEVNLVTTERVYDSDDVVASDPIYGSTHVYNSTNCNACQNIIYCDGSHQSNFAIACQRSGNLNYCLRVDDSANCSNSYNVICSGKISHSLFIQDASDLHECIFCSHLANHEYCIGNMQFEKDEYYFLKNKIIDWILGQKA